MNYSALIEGRRSVRAFLDNRSMPKEIKKDIIIKRGLLAITDYS